MTPKKGASAKKVGSPVATSAGKTTTAETGKAKYARYFAFVLSIGKTEYCDTKKEARLFEKENGDIISERIPFFTKGEFEKHKQNKVIPVTPTKAKMAGPKEDAKWLGRQKTKPS